MPSPDAATIAALAASLGAWAVIAGLAASAIRTARPEKPAPPVQLYKRRVPQKSRPAGIAE